MGKLSLNVKKSKNIQKLSTKICLFFIFFQNLLGVWQKGLYKWQKQLICSPLQWTIGLRIVTYFYDCSKSPPIFLNPLKNAYMCI